MAEILTPDCPLCGQPPYMVMGGGTQAFCGTDECRILTWNPSRSIDDNLTDAHFVRLTLRGEDGEPERPALTCDRCGAMADGDHPGGWARRDGADFCGECAGGPA